MPRSSSREDGIVNVLVGTQTNGQGHDTAYAQVLHSRLNVPFEKIRIVQGDTDRIKAGGGTGGSRSLTAQGMAINDASDLVIERGKAFAAQLFEAAAADIQFQDGTFRVAGTDRAIDIMELAGKARTMAPSLGMEGGLDAAATTKLSAWTFPNGCHIAEVEVDPDTGIGGRRRLQHRRRFRRGPEPDAGRGPGAWRHRAGHRPGAARGCGLRRQRPAADRLVHGLHHAARRQHAVLRLLDRRGALQEQRDGREGLRRGGLGRRTGGGDQRPGRCAGGASACDHVDMPATPEKVWRLAQRRLAA